MNGFCGKEGEKAEILFPEGGISEYDITRDFVQTINNVKNILPKIEKNRLSGPELQNLHWTGQGRAAFWAK